MIHIVFEVCCKLFLLAAAYLFGFALYVRACQIRQASLGIKKLAGTSVISASANADGRV